MHSFAVPYVASLQLLICQYTMFTKKINVIFTVYNLHAIL